MPVSLIALGSNEGNRLANIEAAVAKLRRQPHVAILGISGWHETTPVGGPSEQARFLNGALKVETSLAPVELFALLEQIENRLGRRRGERWGPRTIDLDLLLYDDLVLNSPSLVLPHPRMAWRRFVLEPAAEVAAEMLHPTTGWTVGRLLEHLNAAPAYVAITGPIAAGKSHLALRLAAAAPARLVEEQPDWRQLDAFYADPAGHAWQVEHAFLRQRARLLARGDWPSQGWTVSDFWFDQSAAFARAWLNDQQFPTFLEEYQWLRQNVVRPKLLVLLDAPAEKLLARVQSRGRQCERPLTCDQLDRIRRSVLDQSRQPNVGPVLYADDDDGDAAFAEVLAAVQAME